MSYVRKCDYCGKVKRVREVSEKRDRNTYYYKACYNCKPTNLITRIREHRVVNEICAVFSIPIPVAVFLFGMSAVYLESIGRIDLCHSNFIVTVILFVVFLVFVYFSGDFWEG